MDFTRAYNPAMGQRQRPRRLVICAAMRWEVRPVLRTLRSVRVVRSSPPRIWSAALGASTVFVCQTGVGVAAAAAATELLVRDFSPDVIINTGCAGSLSPHLSVGDVVCGSTLLGTENGEMRQYPTDPMLTKDLEQVARDAGFAPMAGAVLTSAVPLLTGDSKAAAFIQFAAVAVEMEGAAIAAAIGNTNLSLGSMRVILDDVTMTLPAPRQAGNTMFDFAKNTAASILSVEQVIRFSVAAKNAVIVDRVLGKLFRSYLDPDV